MSNTPEWQKCFSLLFDSNVSEIEANGHDSFFCKRNGRREKLPIDVGSDARYMEGIREGLIPRVESVGSARDVSSYLFEGLLRIRSDSSTVRGRCHIVLPPACTTAQVTIAKKTTSLPTLNDIASGGSMSLDMLDFLSEAIKAKMTIAFSGGTGAGKALHVSTPIPTPHGWTTVKNLQAGDEVFAPNGDVTRIVLKYCPCDPLSFDVHFDNGETIRTSAGHLWPTVTDDGQFCVVSSETIASNPSFYRIPGYARCLDFHTVSRPVINDWGTIGRMVCHGEIPHDFNSVREVFDAVLGESREDRELFMSGLTGNAQAVRGEWASLCVHVIASLGWSVTTMDEDRVAFSTDPQDVHIVGVDPVEADPHEFFCFGVDHPSHVFLCGDTCIATHNTTMLEACTKLIDHNVRIGVAEDIPELVLNQPNVTYLHSVPWRPGMNPNDEATLSWVVQQFQRMRTDRLIIGETRGAEFADFLTAANSGMEGSMTTIHANSPTRCLDKMTNFALKGAPNLPTRAVNSDISSALDIIVQLIITSEGQHRVASIYEVTDTVGNSEDAKITTQPLFTYVASEDKFVKEESMTDKLARRMANNGVDVGKLNAVVRGRHVPSARRVSSRGASRHI